MNTHSFIKLFTMLLVLMLAQIVSKAPEVNPNAAQQVADGGTCIPWTPTTCVPGVVQQSLKPNVKMEVADGGTCIPWTPTTCMPGIVQEPLVTNAETEVADGGTCIPWTPETCRLLK